MGSLAEKKNLQNKSNALIGIAIACLVGVFSLLSAFPNNDFANMVVVGLGLVGGVTWFGGLMTYSRSKGYSSITGLLCLLGIVGLLIILVLPDRWLVPAPPIIDPNSNYPRDPNRI